MVGCLFFCPLVAFTVFLTVWLSVRLSVVWFCDYAYITVKANAHASCGAPDLVFVAMPVSTKASASFKAVMFERLYAVASRPGARSRVCYARPAGGIHGVGSSSAVIDLELQLHTFALRLQAVRHADRLRQCAFLHIVF